MEESALRVEDEPEGGPEGPVEVGLPRLLALPLAKILQLFLDRDEAVVGKDTRSYSGFHARNAMVHLDDLLARDYKVLAAAGLPDRLDNPPGPAAHREIEVAPGRFERHLYLGIRLCTDPRGRRFVTAQGQGPIGMLWDVHRGLRVPELDYFVTVYAADPAVSREFLERLERQAKARHIFRGQKIRVGGEFLKLKERGWGDIHVDPAVAEEVRKNVLLPLAWTDRLREVGLPLSRGLLLEGPPGTGKSLLCNVVANEARCTFLLVTPQDIQQVSDIKLVFDIGRELAPTIVLFEDVDVLGDDRSTTPSKSLIGELLAQLDSLETREGVVVLATSNRPGMLDKALVDRPGRFDRRILVDLPGPEQRRKVVEIALRALTVKVAGDVDLSRVAAATDGFSGAHLHDLVQTVAMEALAEANGEDPLLRMAHFEAALERVKGYRVQAREMYV